MDRKTINLRGRSVAAPIKNTPSAEELATMFKTSRGKFIDIDLGVATHEWDMNYIFDFLYYIRDDDAIDFQVDWLCSKWDIAHGVLASFDNANNRELLAQREDFQDNLARTRSLVHKKIQQEDHIKELEVRMLDSFSIDVHAEDNTVMESDSTQQPQFENSDNIDGPQYHMADLPDDVRAHILLADDEMYSLFVSNMREDTWLKVSSNKGKYLDPLRFVCNKFQITAKDTTRDEFDKLLHYVIPGLGDVGNLVSAMKKRSDSNDSANYKYYDSPVYSHRNKCYKLVADGIVIEECLTPVLEKIHNKRWDTKSNPR